jgi:transposase InsO family protein
LPEIGGESGDFLAVEEQYAGLGVQELRDGVQLCFIRPGRPVENGFIESFNGRPSR